MEEVIKRDSQLATDHVLLHIGWAKGAMPLSRAAMGAQLSCRKPHTPFARMPMHPFCSQTPCKATTCA